ncbi:MAG: hypothetical protein IJI14_09840, partial [Anaerolineaceae bacterium]|nr:hypothetical protein [Anaerolineaceae bacterium]
PFHRFPESGSVNRMTDYMELLGYIHTDNIRWSFGAHKGSDGDKWNQFVSQMDMPSLIETIISTGFRGIYIESRAYTEEELKVLKESIENILGYASFTSNDGNLYFYNLYPYIENHPDLLGYPALSLQDIEYIPYTEGTEIIFSSVGYNAGKYIKFGLSQPEKDFSWTDGDTVTLKMKIRNVQKGQILDFTFDLARVFGEQSVTVEVNEDFVAYEKLSSGDLLNFSGVAGDDGIVEIRLLLPDCVSPRELGQSSDGRKLALAIKSLVIFKVQPELIPADLYEFTEHNN